MKKWIAICVALIILCTFPINAAANDLRLDLQVAEDLSSVDYSLFSPEFISRELAKHSNSTQNNINASQLRDALPISVDNSTSLCFPVIGYQGRFGSCSAWASIYYTYTYEVNRLHNTHARKLNSQGQYVNIEENVYSPTWVYDVMTGAAGGTGVCIDWCFEFAQYHGQLSLKDLPYYSQTTPYPNLPTDTNKIVDALSTRISSWENEVITIDTMSNGLITSPTDSRLDAIKSSLADGHVLVVAASWAYNHGDANNGEEIIYRFCREDLYTGEPADGHAITIVGYDDTVGYDINGDGDITGGEWGAFKIANSHGISSENNQGFLWVSYDALNHITSVPSASDPLLGWDHALTTTRAAAFGFYFDINWILQMTVSDYDVDYACVLDTTIYIADHLNVYLKRSKDNGSEATEEVHYHSGAIYLDRGNFNCILAYDYEGLAKPVGNYLSGYTWYMRSSHPESIIINSCTMYDNLAQVIKPFSYNAQASSWLCDLDLLMGDMDYDGVLTTTDFSIIYSYVNGSVEALSNVQQVLADMNADGVINTQDALLVYSLITNNLSINSSEWMELEQMASDLLMMKSALERS